MPRRLSHQDFLDRCVEGMNGCRIYTGPILNSGYGRFADGLAHRYAYRCHKGDIPHGQNVCHTCDVRRCVNPEHLFLGTQAENLRDMDSKGRRNTPRGESAGLARLSADEIRAIRLAPGTYRAIANNFGTTCSHVSRIKNRQEWKHLV